MAETSDKNATTRLDVACVVYFVAEVDTTLLEQGSGFMKHVLEQEALHIVQKGKQEKDFYLNVVKAEVLTSPKTVGIHEQK